MEHIQSNFLHCNEKNIIKYFRISFAQFPRKKEESKGLEIVESIKLSVPYEMWQLNNQFNFQNSIFDSEFLVGKKSAVWKVNLDKLTKLAAGTHFLQIPVRSFNCTKRAMLEGSGHQKPQGHVKRADSITLYRNTVKEWLLQFSRLFRPAMGLHWSKKQWWIECLFVSLFLELHRKRSNPPLMSLQSTGAKERRFPH